MARGHVELDIALTSEDRLSAVITRVNEKMYGFSKATDDANKDANDNFAKITGYVKGVSTTFTELNSKVALVQAAFGALQRAGEFAISGEMANNAEEVFSQITGGAENAAQVMDELRAVTKNTIDDTRIQQFASSLRMAGVEFAEIARILQLSTQVSQVTGEDLFELSKRMQDAAISGAQTEFEKLGVVVNVNEELKKRAEAENTVLEEMTKSEQVTARLNILQDTLAVNLRAAGVDTSRLSTELQGLRTSMENTTSSAQQSLANLVTGETFERMVEDIESVIHAIEKMTGQNIYNTARNKEAQKMLAKGAQISAEQAADALDMLSKRSGTFIATQGGYAKAFARKIIEIKNQNIEKSREEAIESLKAQAVEKEATKQRIEFLIKENQSVLRLLNLDKLLALLFCKF